jgi:uncharacterized protein GlcG (DUF336 family)
MPRWQNNKELFGRVAGRSGLEAFEPVGCIDVDARLLEQMSFELQRMEETTMVTLKDARRIIEAAELKATELGRPMNIAVADGGGNLVAHVRMDEAWLGSIDIAIKKAFTSRAFDISTQELAKYSQSGGQFFGIQASNEGRVMVFAGGVPLKRAGKVVGAVGVSGGSGEQDQAVADAGAKAFG